MADTRYLMKRRQTWYLSLKVPADVREQTGEGDRIVLSLKTRDLSQAQRVRWALVADWHARFEVLRGKRIWTPAEIEEQAQKEFWKCLKDWEEANSKLEDLEPVIDLSTEKLQSGDLTDLDFALAWARISAANGRIAAMNGKQYQAPKTFGRSAIDTKTLRPVSEQKVNAGQPFAETAERFLEESQRDPRSKLTEQTRGQYEAVYRLFDQWAEQPGLNGVDAEKASEFLDVVSKLDPHWGRSPETKRRTFADIMERYGDHETGLSNRTINRYATALSQVWQWAKKRGQFKGDNPWENQSRNTGERRKTQKLPFTADELSKLLAESPTPPKPKSPNAPRFRTKDDEKAYVGTLRWLCHVAAYSGMRLNEICERKVTDIKQEDGVWFIDIVNAKSEAGDRKVPIHSRLIDFGLLEFAKAHGEDWLFPALKPGGPDGKRSWYISKRFTEYRRKLGVVRVDPKTQRDRIDFHSFRRSAIQVLEQARIPQTEVAQVVGHEREGITFGTYNPDGLSIKALKDIVEIIQYDGIG